MSPIGWSHANIVLRLSELLWQGGTYQVSVQNPLRLDRYNEPRPDVALLRRDHDPTGPMLAKHAVLVVEVADSSLSFHVRVKLPRYAQAGIPEAWIVDVEHRRIEVFRNPDNGRYLDRRILAPGDRIDEPGGAAIEVVDVFP